MGQRINWKVDLILDKAPTNGFSKVLKESGANILHPVDGLRYTDHVATFSFSDTVNFEKIVNFRKSLLRAFETNLYDMIVCNTQEAMTAAYAMTIGQYIPVVFYTHLHSMIFREDQSSDVFLNSYHNFYNMHMEFPDVIIGTQSQSNIDALKSYKAAECALLPMPMSERGLLTLIPQNHVRSGVLFIGRWEKGKNPEAYIKVMAECKLPCKVMTNDNGAKKFVKAFADAGITDYEIRAGIIGDEKVDFIKSARLFFMPSLKENYPFAFLECVGHMPCVVLDTQTWSDNFDSSYFTKVALKDAHIVIKQYYDTIDTIGYYASGAFEYVEHLDNTVSKHWVDFLNNFKGKKSNTNVAKINEHETVVYSEYIESLGRTHLAREDFESVLSNRHKFPHIMYTDKNTFLSKDPNFVPFETEELFAFD